MPEPVNVGLVRLLLERLQDRVLRTAMTPDLAVGTAEARRRPLSDDERRQVATVARDALKRAREAQQQASARTTSSSG